MRRYLHCLGLLLCVAFLYSCAKDRDIAEAVTPDPRLLAKYSAYVALAGTYPEDDCDWLLFGNLISAAGGSESNPERARDGVGQWYRTPAQDCYPDRSASTISRDMFLGLFWYAWAQNRPDLAEQVFDYGIEHVFVMGEGPLSRTYMTENLQFTLARLSKSLGGKDYDVWRFDPAFPSGLTDFEAHLQALLIALNAVMGYGTDSGADAAVELVSRQPNNALFAAVNGLYTGDQTTATTLLLNEAWWPADRLPTSADRCSPWITQRDEGAEWAPCPEQARTHSGGDFLFAAAIVLGKLHEPKRAD